MKLNVGPGPHYAGPHGGGEWTNMDIEGTSFRRDLTGDLLNLPPEVKDVELVYLGHVLEHIEFPRLVSALSALRERMVPGGTLAVVGPDVLRAEEQYRQGRIPLELLNTCKAHDNPEPGGSHLWDCTEQLVIELLKQAGYRDVHAVDVATSYELSIFPVVSRVDWQCAVIAVAMPTAPKMKTQPAARRRAQATKKTTATAKPGQPSE